MVRSLKRFNGKMIVVAIANNYIGKWRKRHYLEIE